MGVGRIAGSAAHRAVELFSHRGVTEVRFHVLTCRGRQRVSKVWHPPRACTATALQGPVRNSASLQRARKGYAADR